MGGKAHRKSIQFSTRPNINHQNNSILAQENLLQSTITSRRSTSNQITQKKSAFKVMKFKPSKEVTFFWCLISPMTNQKYSINKLNSLKKQTNLIIINKFKIKKRCKRLAPQGQRARASASSKDLRIASMRGEFKWAKWKKSHFIRAWCATFD